MDYKFTEEDIDHLISQGEEGWTLKEMNRVFGEPIPERFGAWRGDRFYSLIPRHPIPLTEEDRAWVHGVALARQL